MSDERCAAFGPLHHFLVGASLLASAWQTVHHDGVGLSEALTELDSRAVCVPGATCAKWGMCGAAASCGVGVSAVLAGNAPLRLRFGARAELMVSEDPGRYRPGGTASLLQASFAHRRCARPSHGLTTILPDLQGR